MNWSFHLTFGLYVILLLAIGVYFFRTGGDEGGTDYLLADREIGFLPMGLSEAASVASGWTFFAWVGVGFETGLNGLIFSGFFVAMVVFLYLVMGRAFRRQSGELDSMTVTDHLARVFRGHAAGRVIRWIGTLAVILFFGTYVGVQLQSVGKALGEGFDLSYEAGVLGGGLVIAAYTSMGGFRASVWTDFLQSLVMIVAVIALPVVAVMEIGGWGAFLAEARRVDPTLLSLSGGLSGTDLLLNVAVWGGFALAVIGQPHSLMRFQAVSSEKQVLPACVVAVVFQTIRMVLPLFIGISGRILYEQADKEQVGVMLLTDLFPPAVAGLLLAGVVSAIISTSDSMIIVATSDVLRTMNEAPAIDVDFVRLGRVLVGVFALLGAGLALWNPGTIFSLTLFAFVGLGVTFGLPLLVVLLWPSVSVWGVLACMVVGLVGAMVHKFYLLPEQYPILIWPVAAGTILLFGSLPGPSGRR